MSLNNKIREMVQQHCHNNFITWRSQLLNYSKTIEDQAPGLTDRLSRFIDENRPSFYKDFNKRCEKKMLSVATKALEGLSISKLPSLTDLNLSKERLYLEAYLTNNKNGYKTARALNIPKSTFFDWIKQNNELIIAEEHKTIN